MSIDARDYFFSHIEVSDNPKKKYKAVLKLRNNQDVEHFVYFGDVEKDHYVDKTRLNAYPSKNKGNKKIKEDFKKNFLNFAETIKDEDKPKILKYSPLWFEKKCLY